MKYLSGLFAILLFFIASGSYAQIPPPGEKENPFAKEYEKQGLKVPKPILDSASAPQDTDIVYTPLVPDDIDSFEMQFLAEYIQDPNGSIGIFDIPGEDDPMRTLKNGKYPEEDSTYIDIAIHLNVLKLNSVEAIKGSFDSLIFVKMPPMQQEHDASMTFYPFPSTRWLLFLKKGIITSDGQVKAQDWVGDLKNDISGYSFLTEQTAFYLNSPHFGNYYLKWSNEPIPNGVIKVDDRFVSDIKDIVAFLGTVPPGTDKQSFKAKVETLKPKLRTDKAKYLCVYLKP